MPKQKTAEPGLLPAESRNKQVIEENEHAALRSNTHYRTLHLDFSEHVAYIPSVCTYEGLPLCCLCLQFRRPEHFSKSRIEEAGCTVALVKDAKPCAKCGLPVRTLRRNANYEKAHRNKPSRDEKSICQKVQDMGFTVESWEIHPAFGTLVCPACQVPGFNLIALQTHIRNNECGDRKTYAQRKQGAFAMKAVECKKCQFWFHPLLLNSHICGIALDPVWLGTTEMPDLMKPFAVYCNELPPPFGPAGYGGGFIRKDGQGRIPENVLRASWHVPFSVTTRFMDHCVKDNDVQLLIHRLIRLLAKEEHENPPGQARPGALMFNTEWARLLEMQSVDQKLQGLWTATEYLTRINNEKLMQDHNISYDRVVTGKCPGYAWRLSQVACPYNMEIHLGTVLLHPGDTSDGSSLYLKHTHCFHCQTYQAAIQSWIDRNKYNADHVRLCTRPNCLEPLLTAVRCAKHHNAMKESAVRQAQMALQEHALSTGGYEQEDRRLLNLSKTRRRLWRILSPNNLHTFYTTLSALRVKPWDWYSDWGHVAKSITSEVYDGPKVFHIDTESYQLVESASTSDNKKILKPLEISILDRLGNELFTTTVDYQMQISKLMEGCSSQFIAKACEIYCAKDASGTTRGMTVAQIKAALGKLGFQKQGCILLEHSSSSWDWKSMHHLLGDDYVPETSLTTFQLLSLLDYNGPKALQTMFLLTYPESSLNKLHHRALWDACKMYIILQCIFTHRVVPEEELVSITTQFINVKLGTTGQGDDRPQADDVYDHEDDGEDKSGDEGIDWE